MSAIASLLFLPSREWLTTAIRISECAIVGATKRKKDTRSLGESIINHLPSILLRRNDQQSKHAPTNIKWIFMDIENIGGSRQEISRTPTTSDGALWSIIAHRIQSTNIEPNFRVYICSKFRSTTSHTCEYDAENPGPALWCR
jgi:hypothetical protein